MEDIWELKSLVDGHSDKVAGFKTRLEVLSGELTQQESRFNREISAHKEVLKKQDHCLETAKALLSGKLEFNSLTLHGIDDKLNESVNLLQNFYGQSVAYLEWDTEFRLDLDYVTDRLEKLSAVEIEKLHSSTHALSSKICDKQEAIDVSQEAKNAAEQDITSCQRLTEGYAASVVDLATASSQWREKSFALIKEIEELLRDCAEDEEAYVNSENLRSLQMQNHADAKEKIKNDHRELQTEIEALGVTYDVTIKKLDTIEANISALRTDKELEGLFLEDLRGTNISLATAFEAAKRHNSVIVRDNTDLSTSIQRARTEMESQMSLAINYTKSERGSVPMLAQSTANEVDIFLKKATETEMEITTETRKLEVLDSLPLTLLLYDAETQPSVREGDDVQTHCEEHLLDNDTRELVQRFLATKKQRLMLEQTLISLERDREAALSAAVVTQRRIDIAEELLKPVLEEQATFIGQIKDIRCRIETLEAELSPYFTGDEGEASGVCTALSLLDAERAVLGGEISIIQADVLGLADRLSEAQESLAAAQKSFTEVKQKRETDYVRSEIERRISLATLDIEEEFQRKLAELAHNLKISDESFQAEACRSKVSFKTIETDLATHVEVVAKSLAEDESAAVTLLSSLLSTRSVEDSVSSSSVTHAAATVAIGATESSEHAPAAVTTSLTGVSKQKKRAHSNAIVEEPAPLDQHEVEEDEKGRDQTHHQHHRRNQRRKESSISNNISSSTTTAAQRSIRLSSPQPATEAPALATLASHISPSKHPLTEPGVGGVKGQQVERKEPPLLSSKYDNAASKRRKLFASQS